jgi:DNA repair protein RAD5
MGKTIMLSALIQTSCGPTSAGTNNMPSETKRRQIKLDSAFKPVTTLTINTRAVSLGPAATLIVAPTSLLNQWAEELMRSSVPGTMSVLVWHGTNRLDLDGLLNSDGKNIVVVVTSYGVLASEHAKTKSPVYESKQP